MTIKHNCKHHHDKHCAHNGLKIMSGFVGMGEFLSGAIGKCTPMNNANALQTKRQAICAQYSLKLVQQLGNVDRASVQMSKDCELTHDQRLYLEQEDEEDDVEASSGNSATLALAALLPFTAVLSFVLGNRIKKASSVQPRDCEALVGDVE